MEPLKQPQQVAKNELTPGRSPSFIEIWLLLFHPVCHGIVYPIGIGYARWGSCSIYFRFSPFTPFGPFTIISIWASYID